jgi:hypothetical protein
MHNNLLLKTLIANGSKNNQQQDMECILLRIYPLTLRAMKSLESKKKFCAAKLIIDSENGY